MTGSLCPLASPVRSPEPDEDLKMEYKFIPRSPGPDGATLILMAPVIEDDDPCFRLLVGRLFTESGFAAVGDAGDGHHASRRQFTIRCQPTARKSERGDRRV
jgi:hypothetical protein